MLINISPSRKQDSDRLRYGHADIFLSRGNEGGDSHEIVKWNTSCSNVLSWIHEYFLVSYVYLMGGTITFHGRLKLGINVEHADNQELELLKNEDDYFEIFRKGEWDVQMWTILYSQATGKEYDEVDGKPISLF
ncbi:MAG: hypothetical protein WCI55_12260 [Armatimonadota bacterium]